MSRIRRQSLSFVAPVTLAATLFLASCLDDPSGPGIQPGFLALAPSFESSAAGIVDVASVHVRLIRDSDETVALDDTFAIDPESETVDLSFSVMVTSSGETFTLDLECLSPTGEVVFRAEGLTVTATTGNGDNVVAQDVPIQYVGVGSNAASVTILTAEPTVRFGDTLLLTAEVLDSSGAVIEGTPIQWIAHDTTRVTVPDAGQGLIVGNRVRDWVHVEALLLTGPADTADVMVEPVPNAVTVVAGGAQSGTVNTELANPIVVRVDAVDGPMAEVVVELETAGDGYFGLSSVVTDASGQASTTWTLGSTVGVQTGTATVGTFVATFTATAGTPYEPTLNFTVQPSRAALAEIITPAVEVSALDGFGLVDEAFAGNISIAIANNPGSGTLSGTTTLAASGGVATFGDLYIDLSGTGYTLTATAFGYLSATSQPFDVVAIPPGTDAIWEGASSTDWNTPANWSTNTVPTDVENVWIPQAPLNQPLVSTYTSIGSVVVQTGASITLGPDGVLAVFGDLDAGTSIVGDGWVSMNTAGSSLTGTVHNVEVNANTTLSGPATATGTVAVNGGQFALGGNTLDVTGAISTSGTGIIVMNNAADVLNTADASFGGGSTDTYLTAGALNVSGNFVQASTNSTASFAASGTHRTVFNGSGVQTVQFASPGTDAGTSHFMEVEAEGSAAVELVYTVGNDAYVNGSLSIRGSANVDPNCQTIQVAGNLNTTESGTLTMMCDDWDNVVVAGDANFGGGSTVDMLTAGMLAIGGRFEQLNTTSDLSFAPSLNHLTRLDGGLTQTVSFASPDSTNGSHFNNLEIRQSNGEVTLNTLVFAVMVTIMDFDIMDLDPAVLSGPGEIIVGDGFITQSDNTSVVVEPYAVRIGDYLSNQGTFQPTVTEFFGPGTQQVPSTAGEIYTDIVASGTDVQFGSIDMGGTLAVTGNADFNYYAYTMNITGDLVISGNGQFTMWESHVTVGGDLRTQDSGILTMEWSTDVLDVNGSAIFGGGSTSATLTNGTLSVGGDFTQTTAVSAQSFAPDSNHVVVLNGTGAQQVTFDSPAMSESRFGDLRIENTSTNGIVLNSAVMVRDDFLTPTDAVTRNMSGQGNTITAYSVDIQNVVFDNLPLDILYDTYYSDLIDIDYVTFQNMDPTVVQLNIVRDWESGFFDNLTFSSTPTTGLYVYLDDFDDMINNPVFEFLGTSPAVHGGFAQTDGQAQLFNWPSS